MKKRKRYRRYIPLFFMMLPGFAYLLVNNYMPLFGLIIAFKKMDYSKGIWKSDWLGLRNFEFLFRTSDAFVITRNTILYNIAFIVINTILALLIAILLNEIRNKHFAKFYQTVIILPSLISMIIVSYLAYAFLSADNGYLNNTILKALHMESVSWYTKASAWPFILIFINAWKGVGQTSLIYFAAVIGVNKDYYESAMLDGAGFWKRLYYITLPCIRSVIIVMVLLAIGKIFYSDFGLFFQVPMNSGAIYSTTNTIDTYVYRGLMELGDVGMSSAAGLYQSVVGFILVLISNLIVKKIDPDSAMF